MWIPPITVTQTTNSYKNFITDITESLGHTIYNMKYSASKTLRQNNDRNSSNTKGDKPKR